jgi:hypothetical protein
MFALEWKEWKKFGTWMLWLVNAAGAMWLAIYIVTKFGLGLWYV